MQENIKGLCLAIKTNDWASFKQAFAALGKFDPHIRVDCYEYFTPWHWVYNCIDIRIIKALLEIGADPNCVLEEINGETVVFGAVLNSNSRIIEMLKKYGAELNTMNSNGETPLHVAVNKEDGFETIKTLILQGADIEYGGNIMQVIKDDEHIETFCDAVLDALREMSADGHMTMIDLKKYHQFFTNALGGKSDILEHVNDEMRDVKMLVLKKITTDFLKELSPEDKEKLNSILAEDEGCEILKRGWGEIQIEQNISYVGYMNKEKTSKGTQVT